MARGLIGFLRGRAGLILLPGTMAAGVVVLMMRCTGDLDPPVTFVDILGEANAGNVEFTRVDRAQVLEHPGRLFVHPGQPGEPASAVRVPMRVAAGSCLSVRLRLHSAEGDGVLFRVSVEAGGETSALAEETLTSARMEVRLDLALERWQGQAMTLVLSTEPGASNAFDWASFVDPVVHPCERGQR